jgi:hypothetical protein
MGAIMASPPVEYDTERIERICQEGSAKQAEACAAIWIAICRAVTRTTLGLAIVWLIASWLGLL